MTDHPVVNETTSGHDSLIAVRDHPLVAASPLWALVPAVTPSSSVYVRSNFPTPAIDIATYRLFVEGAVERPLQFSMDELQQFPSRTLVMTMECAGNDRLGMRPVPDGEPWNQGAVSTVRWRGIALCDVLRAAGIASSAIEVVAWGADQGMIDERTTHFARSLPLPVALEQDTLLAFELNDTPLTPDHGFPVRLVVPGWYGMASVKWLSKLELVTTPFTGYFQRKRYVYDVGGRTEPVTRMRVKSIITSPGEGARCAAGLIEVRGWAWSGNGRIESVDVYCDDAPPVRAHLGISQSPHAWVPWSANVSVSEGDHVLHSRAADTSGAVQPDEIEWNRLGYGNNAVRGVTVSVA